MKITLEGKVALVTGAGSGIGKAIAEAYAEIGAKLVVAEIDAGKCAALRNQFGEGALIVECDVTKTDQVGKLRDQIAERFGAIHVIVNNVGHHYGIRGPLENSSEEDWERLYDVNLKHMFIVTKAMLPLMKQTPGDRSIINLSSIEGFRGFPNSPVYTTFKHAVTGFTRAMAIQLAGDGIRVNLIGPETTDTEQVPLEKLLKPETRSDSDRTIPLGRYGKPEDHAGPAVFLATEMSIWMTGSSLVVDGGGLTAGGFQRTPQGDWTIIPTVTGKGTF